MIPLAGSGVEPQTGFGAVAPKIPEKTQSQSRLRSSLRLRRAVSSKQGFRRESVKPREVQSPQGKEEPQTTICLRKSRLKPVLSARQLNTERRAGRSPGGMPLFLWDWDTARGANAGNRCGCVPAYSAETPRQVTLRSLTAFFRIASRWGTLGCRPDLPEGHCPSDSLPRFALIFAA